MNVPVLHNTTVDSKAAQQPVVKKGVHIYGLSFCDVSYHVNLFKSPCNKIWHIKYSKSLLFIGGWDTFSVWCKYQFRFLCTICRPPPPIIK
jgi:hypothetical protein